MKILSIKIVETKVLDIIETVKPLKSNYPLELEQGDFGKLIIEDVKITQDKTIVRFSAQGVAQHIKLERE